MVWGDGGIEFHRNYVGIWIQIAHSDNQKHFSLLNSEFSDLFLSQWASSVDIPAAVPLSLKSQCKYCAAVR